MSRGAWNLSLNCSRHPCRQAPCNKSSCYIHFPCVQPSFSGQNSYMLHDSSRTMHAMQLHVCVLAVALTLLMLDRVSWAMDRAHCPWNSGLCSEGSVTAAKRSERGGGGGCKDPQPFLPTETRPLNVMSILQPCGSTIFLLRILALSTRELIQSPEASRPTSTWRDHGVYPYLYGILCTTYPRANLPGAARELFDFVIRASVGRALSSSREGQL